jgi:hypothetical protein
MYVSISSGEVTLKAADLRRINMLGVQSLADPACIMSRQG